MSNRWIVLPNPHPGAREAFIGFGSSRFAISWVPAYQDDGNLMVRAPSNLGKDTSIWTKVNGEVRQVRQ